MNNDNIKAFPLPVTKSYPRRKRIQTIFLLDNHPCNTNNRSDVKPPKHIDVHNLFDCPISQMSITTSTSKLPFNDVKKKQKFNKKFKPKPSTTIKHNDKEIECKVND